MYVIVSVIKKATYFVVLKCDLMFFVYLEVISKYSLQSLKIILNIAIKYICIIFCLPLNFPIVQSPSHLK
jgi:hypothetical protein